MLAKEKSAINPVNSFVQSICFQQFKEFYFKVSSTEKNKDNFIIECDYNPNYRGDKDCQEDVVYSGYTLDGIHYDHDNAYGKKINIVCNVTSEYIQMFLDQYGNRKYKLSCLRKACKTVIDLLPRASKEQEIEILLRCLILKGRNFDDPANLNLIVYQNELDTIIETCKKKYYYRNSFIVGCLIILLFYFTDVYNKYKLVTTISVEFALLFFIKNQYTHCKTLLVEYQKVKRTPDWQTNVSDKDYRLDYNALTIY